VAATTDPDIQAARRRIKDTVHDLRDHGFNKMSRKQMLYRSREWSQKSRNSQSFGSFLVCVPNRAIAQSAIRNPSPLLPNRAIRNSKPAIAQSQVVVIADNSRL
jgi:hypothetical protein